VMWFPGYDVATKAQSFALGLKTSPRFKKHGKIGQCESGADFFGSEYVIRNEFPPRGVTVI